MIMIESKLFAKTAQWNETRNDWTTKWYLKLKLEHERDFILPVFKKISQTNGQDIESEESPEQIIVCYKPF